MKLIGDIAASIGTSTCQPFELAEQREAGGGCINRALILRGKDRRRFFVKVNAARHTDMFAAEAAGLAELDTAAAIQVPRPIAQGTSEEWAYLVLEWLDIDGRGNGAKLGRQLAQLHRTTSNHFGWHRDNTIGSTPQVNFPATDWIDFFGERRLGYQLRLAERNGAPRRLLANGERLVSRLGDFFAGYHPAPSLLHGDLWGGNHGYVDGQPVLFDPAVYFGDREADLAMTELFGGFSADFHAAYREAWPLDPGFDVRKHLYNLYHVLNHFNLFGGGYAGQAQSMTERLLAESR